MSLRNLVFRLGLDDEVKDRLLEVKEQLEALQNMSVEALIGVKVSGLEEAKKSVENAGKSINKSLGNETKGLQGRFAGITSSITEMGTRASGVFSAVGKATTDLKNSVGDLAGAFVALSAGAAVSGLSYLDAVKNDLKDTQTYAKFDNNKKFGVTGARVKEAAESYRGSGYTRPDEMLDTISTVYQSGGKKVKGEKGIKIADQAAKAYLKNKESMDEQGINAAYLAMLAVRPGQLKPAQRRAFADAMGVSQTDSKLNSDAGRKKLLERQAATMTPEQVKIELDKRPWLEAENNIKDLKKAIGLSLAGPMGEVTGIVSKLAQTIAAIPGAPGLIAFLGICVALVGVIGMLVSVVTPALTLFKAIQVAMFGNAAAAAASAASKTALAASTMAAAYAQAYEAAMISGATAAEAGLIASDAVAVVGNTALATSNTGVAASAWAMASGLWAAIAPILLIAIPLIALAALLYIVESKTQIFRKALKALSQTQMAADFIQFFKDVGYWIVRCIGWIDGLYKMLKGGGLGALVSGGLKMSLAFGPMGIMLKVLLSILGALDSIFGVNKNLAKLSEMGGNLLKRISEFLAGLLAKIQSLGGWIKDGLGITKWQAETKLADALEDKGGKGARYFSTPAEASNAMWWDGPGFYSAIGRGGRTKIEDAKLDKLKENVDKAPNSVFDQIGEVIAGAMTRIKEIFDPVLTPLSDAVNRLVDWLKTPATNAARQTAAGLTNAGIPAAATSDDSKVYWPLKGGDPITAGEWKQLTIGDRTSNYRYSAFGDPRDKKEGRKQFIANLIAGGASQRDAEAFADQEGYASGFTVGSTGTFSGKLHRNEELLNQAQVQKGPGPISRALDELYSRSPMGRQSPAANQNSISIGNLVRIDKIENGADIDNLVFRIRGELERLGTRGIGYLRGGAVGR